MYANVHRAARAEARVGAGRFGVVALAASLGSLAALTRVLSALPAAFPARGPKVAV